MISIVAISLFVHSAYYILIFSRLAFYNEKAKNRQESKVTILICYKNEKRNIDKCLQSILSQDFDELILIDDNSTDSTLEKLKAHESQKVKVVAITEETNGKKNALATGINLATNDQLLLTDADCIPSSIHWAGRMSENPKDFVLGYAPMNKGKGWIALFSRFETYMTALQYLAYALIGIPYMGVGRNMKVSKQLVLKNKNSIKGSNLASGDDDLMINSLSNKQNTVICINPESFVYSDPKITLRDYVRQKTRHISTSVYYKPIHQVLLALFSGSQILFFVGLLIGTIIGTISLKLSLLLILVKWTIQQTINAVVMKKLKEEDLFWKFPLLDLLFFVYLLLMPIYYLFNKNNTRWS